MGLLNVIRRMALRQKLPIREIARRTGLSRNTIKKYLNSGTVEPKFAVPERPSKLDPFADKLAAWLKTEASKSRKQRRPLTRLHADLVALGFTGSYGRVAAFARAWRADRQREQQTTGRGSFVPLTFRAGEAFQFDWSEDYALKTLRLILSPCAPVDRVNFIQLELDPEVMRFLNNGAVDHDRIDSTTAPFLMPRGTEPNVWTARRNADDEFVGWFCLLPKGRALAEIGYRLRREAWGQGLATEGALALIGWGFEVAGYDKIVANTMAVNQGSRRVMEKVGMIHTRTDFLDFPDPIPGTEHGEVTYELSCSEWANN